MSVDPLAEKYAYNSTYAFQENKMGLGRELEGLELSGAPFNKFAADFGKAVTGVLDSIKLVFSSSTEQEIVPKKASLVNSKTTTISGNFTNYAMSSQYPNWGEADLFNSPVTEYKSQIQVANSVTVVVEGVTITASHTESKDVKSGKRESESKVVAGAGTTGVFVSKTKSSNSKSETRAGVQTEVSLPVNASTKVKFGASISIENPKKRNDD